MQTRLQTTQNIRELTRFCKHAKLKRDVLWENGLQIHLIFKKRRNFAKWQNCPFCKGYQNHTKNGKIQKTAKIQLIFLKNDTILKCGKNDHFVVRQNGQK